MIYNIIIKEQAEKDLLRIKLYISYELNDPINADKIIERIIFQIENLSYFPNKYRIFSNQIRVCNLNSFSIYYTVENNNIYVLRILGNKQQFNYFDIKH